MTMLVRWLAVGVLAASVVFGAGWFAWHPEAGDAKGPQYFFWRLGLWRIDASAAVNAMWGDPDREALVIGKSPSQLREQFGYLRSFSEVGPDLQYCVQHGPWKNQHGSILFLRDSWFMVAFRNNEAVQLSLEKGC